MKTYILPKVLLMFFLLSHSSCSPFIDHIKKTTDKIGNLIKGVFASSEEKQTSPPAVTQVINYHINNNYDTDYTHVNNHNTAVNHVNTNVQNNDLKVKQSIKNEQENTIYNNKEITKVKTNNYGQAPQDTGSSGYGQEQAPSGDYEQPPLGSKQSPGFQ